MQLILLAPALLASNIQADICISLCHVAAVAMIKATKPTGSGPSLVAPLLLIRNVTVPLGPSTNPPSALSFSVHQKSPDTFWHGGFHTPLNWTSPRFKSQSYPVCLIQVSSQTNAFVLFQIQCMWAWIWTTYWLRCSINNCKVFLAKKQTALQKIGNRMRGHTVFWPYCSNKVKSSLSFVIKSLMCTVKQGKYN